MFFKLNVSVSALESKLSRVEHEKSLLKAAAAKTEDHCKMLIEQQSKLADILEKRIPLEHHEASVLECKKYGSEKPALVSIRN